MNFSGILDGVEALSQSGNPSITGLQYDSRRIQPGNLFVAINGESSDGNRFIDQAIANGVVAVVSDSTAEVPRSNVAWATVEHGRRALGRLSANYYGHPGKRIAITGITGTNGKSTTAFMMEAILRAAGRANILIGTVEYHVADKILPAPHTTPESLELNRFFADALAAGATEAVMEVSSHALAQERVFDIPFDVAVFTNLTRDHLDYHGTMEQYFHSKQVLFEGCGTPAPRVAVLNIDDEYGVRLSDVSAKHGSEVLTYGWSKGDFHVIKADVTPQNTKLDLATPAGNISVVSTIIGRVNVYNLMAACAAAYARGCDAESIVAGLATLKNVPGRFERVDCGQPFTVVVDYAHTDDALRNLITLAREFVSHVGRQGRVIVVFGCGGDRDRSKRPLMGEAAGKGSDFVVLTSDNPRSEDPIAIMNDSMVGLQRAGAKYKMEPNRKLAIAVAISEAKPGDMVLIAGKGHEKVQIMRDGPHPFDDVKVAAAALTEAGFDCAKSQRGVTP
jgi:UDP-N-acetylmuramoyl-L-alanyl-D-glutamate--2,6-diaminopimelate ligase